MNLIKNISKSEVHVLKDQVTYQEGQVVSMTPYLSHYLPLTRTRRSAHTSPAAMHLLPA